VFDVDYDSGLFDRVSAVETDTTVPDRWQGHSRELQKMVRKTAKGR